MENTYKVTTTENFDVCINVLGTYGYFEHHTLGKECGGGLWFEDGELSTYGYFEHHTLGEVYNLPLEVLAELDSRGVHIDRVFFPE